MSPKDMYSSLDPEVHCQIWGHCCQYCSAEVAEELVCVEGERDRYVDAEPDGAAYGEIISEQLTAEHAA